MVDNKISVIDQDNNKYEVEVLDIFGVVGYEDKEYILYTQNEEVDDDNIKVYVSILEETMDGYKLTKIEDEKEFEAVQIAINEKSRGDLDE